MWGATIALAKRDGRARFSMPVLEDKTFISRATTGFEAIPRGGPTVTRLRLAERVTGIPADVIRDAALAYAKADTRDDLLDAGDHGASQRRGTTSVALINLALLTGHVGRYGCGCNPLRGQNNVQGGGDMGALPNKLPGFQDMSVPEEREKVRAPRGGP